MNYISLIALKEPEVQIDAKANWNREVLEELQLSLRKRRVSCRKLFDSAPLLYLKTLLALVIAQVRYVATSFPSTLGISYHENQPNGWFSTGITLYSG